MRNIIIGAFFGCVTGAVIGATVIGPELVVQIPGFVKHPLDNNKPILPFVRNHIPFTYEPQSSKPNNAPKKLINKNLLNSVEVKWINKYHASVFKNLKRFMNKIELTQLKDACSNI